MPATAASSLFMLLICSPYLHMTLATQTLCLPLWLLQAVMAASIAAAANARVMQRSGSGQLRHLAASGSGGQEGPASEAQLSRLAAAAAGGEPLGEGSYHSVGGGRDREGSHHSGRTWPR